MDKAKLEKLIDSRQKAKAGGGEAALRDGIPLALPLRTAGDVPEGARRLRAGYGMERRGRIYRNHRLKDDEDFYDQKLNGHGNNNL